jgi:drug/metabolite transporter (DMT)-like permease
LKKSSAITFLIFAGLLWSTGGFMVKMIIWPPLVIAGIRSGICALVIILFDKPKKIIFGKYTIGGAICYMVMVISFIIANKLTTSANVILIQYTAPIYVAILSFSFLGEKSTKFDWTIILIVLSGLALFFLHELSFTNLYGNIFALFSGFGFAGTTLFLRKQKNGRPIDSVILGNILTFVVCLPFIFQDITFDSNSWIRVTYLGVFQLGVAYIFYSKAIRFVSAIDAIIYPVIEPICNPILAFIFLGELMSRDALIGGLLIISGIIFKGIFDLKNKEAPL